MTVYLEISPEFKNFSDFPDFNQCILTTLSDQGLSLDSDLTLVIGDDERLRSLNSEFLGNDKPTDVLAFPAGHVDPDTGHTYLGDIIISLPRAKTQALAAGHTISAELSLLTLHGLLHLLGYDHDLPEQKTKMWKVQNQTLDKLGLKISLPD